jgi:hypothetical protein
MREHIEAALAALGLKPVFGGAAMSVLGWLNSSAGAAWCGVWIAFAGLLLNWRYNARKDRREQEAHEARMKGLV